MKAMLWAGVLWSLSLVMGCGPGIVVLRSNHYRIVVPENWKVEAAQSPGLGSPTVLRVPPGKLDSPGDGLELRVYGWVDTTAADEATAQAVARLSVADDPALRAVLGRDDETCRGSKKVWLLGEYRRAVYLRGSSNRLLVVTAGRAAGSVVAVVGTWMPNGQPPCYNALVVESAIAKLGTALTGGSDPNRVESAPVPLEDPHGVTRAFLPPLNPAP